MMKIPSWLWKDWVTWIVHGLQGVAVMAFCDWVDFGVGPAILVLGYHFGVREAEDFFYSDRGKRKLIDGIMDLVSPFVGLGLYLLIKSI